MVHFSLVKCNPPDTPPSHGFDDAILPLYYALCALGYAVELRYNSFHPTARNIVFGSCIAPRRIGRMMPRGSIIFNLEQILAGSKWCNTDYLAHLHDFDVWDYSPANIRELAALGVKNVTHVPLGYVPEMTRIQEDFPRRADVLFYGLMTQRRHELVTSLVHGGIKILATQEAFGDLRDSLLAQSRVVLNIHQFVPAKLEVVRLGYVWANKRAVVSEIHEGDDIPDHLKDACFFALYDSLGEEVARVLGDDAAIRRAAEKAFAAFASQPLRENLRGVLGARSKPCACPPSSLYPGEERVFPYLIRPAHTWQIA